MSISNHLETQSEFLSACAAAARVLAEKAERAGDRERAQKLRKLAIDSEREAKLAKLGRIE